MPCSGSRKRCAPADGHVNSLIACVGYLDGMPLLVYTQMYI